MALNRTLLLSSPIRQTIASNQVSVTTSVNTGNKSVEGKVRAILYPYIEGEGGRIEEWGIVISEQVIKINPGESKSLIFTNSDITNLSGKYILSIEYQKKGQTDWYSINAGQYTNDIPVDMSKVTALDDFFLQHAIKVYPNPAENILYIDYSGTKDMQVSILDMMGKVILTQPLTKSSTIDVSLLKKGMYMLRCTTGGRIGIKKIAIQ